MRNRITGDGNETMEKLRGRCGPCVQHAPNVSGKDVGSGELAACILISSCQGPHGLIVQALDTKEKAAINKRHAGLTQKLCKLKQVWCLPQEHRAHTE
jgi:hypothetical protein